MNTQTKEHSNSKLENNSGLLKITILKRKPSAEISSVEEIRLRASIFYLGKSRAISASEFLGRLSR